LNTAQIPVTYKQKYSSSCSKTKQNTNTSRTLYHEIVVFFLDLSEPKFQSQLYSPAFLWEEPGTIHRLKQPLT